MTQLGNKHWRSMLLAGAALLAAALVNGALIHVLPLQRLAMAAHLLGLLASAILFGLGSFWTKLNLPRRASAFGAVAAIYGFGAAWLTYFTAAATGAGGMFPLLAEGEQGSAWMERAVSAGMSTVALAMLALIVVLLTNGSPAPDPSARVGRRRTP